MTLPASCAQSARGGVSGGLEVIIPRCRRRRPQQNRTCCGFARFNVLKVLCVSAKASAAHTRSRGSGGFEVIIPQTPSGLQEAPRLAGASEATERKQRPGTAAFINRKGLHSFCEGKRPTPCHALRHAAKSTGRPKAPSSTRRFYSAASPR